MGKGGGSETVTTKLDRGTQRFVDQHLRPTAIAGAKQAQSGQLVSGSNRFQNVGIQSLLSNAGAGSRGLEGFMARSQELAGMGGGAFDPASIQTFMDPFQSQVIGGIQANADRQREMASTRAAQQATQAGAFGGSRSAVLESLGRADVNRQEAEQIGQVQSQGFSQALQAALGQQGRADQLGLAGLSNLLQGQATGQGLDLQNAQALLAGGEGMRQIKNQQLQQGLFGTQQALSFLNQGLGPHGAASQTQAGPGNPFAGALGGGLAGFQAGGPLGGLIGGGLGLLGSLF